MEFRFLDREPFSWRTISSEPIGHCIYCGTASGKLTDEHIVPEALNGFLKAKKSCCIKCQKLINQEIEGPLFGGLYKQLRRALGYRSKKQKFRPQPGFIPVNLEFWDGRKELRLLDAREYPPPLLHLEYGYPPFYCETFGTAERITARVVPGDGAINASRLAGVKSASMSVTYKNGAFERFLAKIAIGAFTIATNRALHDSNLAAVVRGEAKPCRVVGKHLSCDFVFSKPKGTEGSFLPLVEVFEVTELGQRTLYCMINVGFGIFMDIFWVRMPSPVTTNRLLNKAIMTAHMIRK